MRFLVDECVGKGVANWLRENGHLVIDVLSSYLKGSDDRTLLSIATMERFVIITKDQDFGDLIFRDGLDNNGLILINDGNMTTSKMKEIIDLVIGRYGNILESSIVTLRDWRVRARHI